MGPLLHHRPALPQDHPGARSAHHRRTCRRNRRSAGLPDPLAWIQDFQAVTGCRPPAKACRASSAGWSAISATTPFAISNPAWRTCPNPDPLDNPDILLLVSEDVVVFDNLAGRLVPDHPGGPGGGTRLRPRPATPGRMGGAAARAVARSIRPAPYCPSGTQIEFVSGFTQQGYEKAVERIKEYILAGDCMQVVPSQRLRRRSGPRRWICTGRCAD
jgi:anthranilate synthase component 1